MVVIEVFPLLKAKYEKELLSKCNFDNVPITEIKKPESQNSGRKTRDSWHESDKMGSVDTPILSDATNFCKEIGGSVSDEGFVKFPRSLWNDPQWKSCRPKYKQVFMTLLFNASYTQKSHSISGNVITLMPGQFCVSMRKLIELCNEGIRFSEDKIDKNIIERSVSLFTKIGFVRHELRHAKSLFTITHPDLYDHFLNQSETDSETKVRQNRDTNEERKKEKKIKDTIDRAYALDSSLSFEGKKEEEETHSAFSPESPYQEKAKTSLDAEKQKHFEALWQIAIKKGIAQGYTKNHKPGVKEQDLITWLKTYEGKEVFECMKLAEGKAIQKSYGAYITKLLKDKIPKKEKASCDGKAFVDKFIKDNKIKHIDMKKDYFKDLISDEQSYYNLPEQTLKAILERSKERARENEEEEKRQKEYEDD